MTKRLFVYLSIVCLGLSGCATSSVSIHEEQEQDTVLETYNRAIFSFNRQVDKFVMRPVAKGYRAVTNEYVRQRVSNFFDNIEEPVSAVNHVLQGEFKGSGNNIGRFVINSTFGVLGLYDVAAKWGLDDNRTGFDKTLASWCVPDGAYIVLPILGPSTPRSAVGFLADGYSSPMYWTVRETSGEDGWSIYYGAMGVKYINLMAENITFLESLEEGSVDYYEAVKSAYLQNRSKIKPCRAPSEDAAVDYDFDMDDME